MTWQWHWIIHSSKKNIKEELQIKSPTAVCFFPIGFKFPFFIDVSRITCGEEEKKMMLNYQVNKRPAASPQASGTNQV